MLQKIFDFQTEFLKGFNLGLEFQAHADLVPSLLEVLAIDQSRQTQSHTFTKLLLVTQTNLGAVVDLSAYKGILVQCVLATDTESSLILGRSPSQVDSSLQTGVDLLVHRSSKNLSIPC